VTWRHFQTFLWLRWRLIANQMRRAGTANLVAGIIVLVLAAGAAVGSAVALFAVGWLVGGRMSPDDILYTWDGIAAAFLFFWLIGLSVELQRAEALSLTKVLHLPVSLRAAFAVNYLSSLICPCMILFLPSMLGLSFGLALGRGPLMLLTLLPLAAFLLAVTALTYQFQGWLAALMSNPRRRRTVVVVTTAVIILLAQLPNLLNVMHVWGKSDVNDSVRRLNQINQRQMELDQAKATNSLPPEEVKRRQDELNRETDAAATRSREGWDSTHRTILFVNAIVPPGWLPYAGMGLAEGNVVPALLGTAGLGLIGGASLWRAYRTTLRMYTGQLTGKRVGAAGRVGPPAAERVATPTSNTPTLLERRLPWVSEQASAIALAGLRGLIRAPEAKMMLLSPIILLFVFGSMFLTRPGGPPVASRPFIATGAFAMILLSMGQLLGNQFGFDRSGFRVFVLCAARRSDILLGKNLSFAPLALGLSAIALVLLEIAYPMRVDVFLAAAAQAVTMFLLYCLAANCLSILAPVPVAAGSMRPTNARIGPVLLHLGFVMVLPVVFSPALLPLGIAVLLEWSGVPVTLVLSLAMCAATIAVYRLALNWQGQMLQSREQRILQVVASKAE
jgi:hypothetical protein